MLSEKVAQLREGATKALTVAEWWETQIATHGVEIASAFYKHCGFNHLETKSVEWEGMTLSREPSDIEKLCIKSISQAQDAGKESLARILLKARTALIDDALKAITKLKPANFHKLILTMPEEFHDEVREQLERVWKKGRSLVASELSRQQGKGWVVNVYVKQAEDDDELDDLTDLTDSRVANEVQTRVTSAAARFALAGLVGAALWQAVSNEINAGSVSYIDRAAQGAANRVLGMGRMAEMNDRADEIGRYEQSAILDPNTCEPCFADDGKTASDPEDLPGGPNPDCAGLDMCRCFVVAILDTVA